MGASSRRSARDDGSPVHRARVVRTIAAGDASAPGTVFRVATVLVALAVVAVALTPSLTTPALAQGTARSAPPLTAPRAELREDLRLDGTAEDFSALGRIFVGPHGRIAIPLRQDYHVRLHDSTGKRIATVGRRGAGPGEFQFVGVGGWVRDTLWVYDIEQRRSVYVAPDGRVLRTVPLPPSLRPMESAPGQLNYFSPFAALADGALLGDARFQVAQRAGADYQWPDRKYVRVSPAGEVTVLADAPGYENQPWYLTVSGFGRTVPFSAPPHVSAAVDGSSIAWLTTDIASRTGGTITATMLDARGARTYERQFAFTGEPIPQRAADSALAAMLPRPGAATEGPSDLPRRFQALARERMPPVYAPVFAIVNGFDGTLWITLRRTSEGQVAVMLDRLGNPALSVRLPPSTRIWAGSPTHIWTTQSDADGMQHVVRYRIVPGR